MKDDRVYLLHLLDAIHRIQSYVTGVFYTGARSALPVGAVILWTLMR